MRFSNRLVVWSALVMWACAACGSSDTQSAGNGDGGTGGSGGGGGGGGGNGDPCSVAAQCAPGVCDPATDSCTDSLTCEVHGDCGAGGYCDDSGACVANDTGGPCDDDVNCPVGETCTGGFCGCVGELFTADSVPPNMLIVLDRSGSMNNSITGGTKWTVAHDAIDTLVTSYGDQIRFGLMLYPGANQDCSSGARCDQTSTGIFGNVFFDPAENTASSIVSFLNDNNTNTCSKRTPSGEALAQLVDYAGLKDTGRPNYILLITDGQSTCNDPVPVVTQLRGLAPEIKTFVVGFGSGVDPNELNDMATEGGTAKPSMPYYYQADNATELEDAFAVIAGSVLSCTYTLSDVPADLSDLYIYFDGAAVGRDQTHTGGWDYDPNSNAITFYGGDCDALQAGQVTDLVITYGCPIQID